MQSPCEANRDAIPQNSPVSNGTFCPQSRRRFVLIAAILASALGFIDGSVVSIAIPTIRADLAATLADAQWISNAYALTLSALILVGGAAGDNFGLHRTFVAGVAVFVLASLGCAIAPGPALLIAARAIQGVGAAIMVPGSLAIIAKAYPKKERGRAIGIWAASSALTMALGPVIGGLLSPAFDDSIWRVIFAINLPLGGVAIYLLLAKVPADKPSEKRKLDLGGAAIATLGLGALAYGLTALSAEGSGSTAARSSALILAGLVLFAGFVVWELRQRDPMVNLSLFRIGAFSGANVATFFLYFALSGVLFFLADAADCRLGTQRSGNWFHLPAAVGCDRAVVRGGRRSIGSNRTAPSDCGRQPRCCCIVRRTGNFCRCRVPRLLDRGVSCDGAHGARHGAGCFAALHRRHDISRGQGYRCRF